MQVDLCNVKLCLAVGFMLKSHKFHFLTSCLCVQCSVDVINRVLHSHLFINSDA